jgi:hypothetical protein
VRSFLRTAAAPALLLSLATLAPVSQEEAWSAAAPGTLAVSAALEPGEIRVGDTARLTVIVDHPPAGNLELPELEQGKAIVVTDRKRETVALAGEGRGGQERTTFVFLLTSFALGEHRVGGGKIAFTGQGGVAVEMPFPESVLRTKSVLPGENAPMRGIKDLARWPAPLGRRAGLAVGLLLLAAAILLGARRRKAVRRDKPATGPVALLPHETALKALAALRGRKPTQQPMVEPFHREMSTIVRRYIEERFALRAPERTTEEFIREATGSGLLSPVHQELVKAFLEQCDLVKFARQQPAPDEVTVALAAAERLVRETKQPLGKVGGP